MSALKEMTAIYQGSLAQPLKFGHVLEIRAKAEEDARRFSIYLCNGKLNTNTHNDIGLILIGNMNKNQIILNQCTNNEWRKEEVLKEFDGATFRSEFKFYIVMAESKFQISINDKPFASYKYGKNLPQLDTIGVDGDLEYIKQVDHRQYFPFRWPPIQIMDDFLDFSNDQPLAFKPGHLIIITAKLLGSINGRFIVQLRNASDNKRSEFHASFRFHAKEYVSNSKTSLQGDILAFDADDAEIEGYLPFDDFSKSFKLIMAFTDHEIKIAKDGEFICDYTYRTRNILPDIVGVKIFGSDGVNVRVSGIDHIQLHDPQCSDFEMYSKE